jgi:hypothetical protein
MSDQELIPTSERYGRLKDILFGFVDQIVAIRSANPNLADNKLISFVFLALPSLVELEGLPPEQRQLVEQRKAEVSRLGFDPEGARLALEEVLAADKHLRECCPTPLHLASYLDFQFFARVDAVHGGMKAGLQEFTYDLFERLTYQQGRFRRIALSHLFNFDMEGDRLVLQGEEPLGEVRIERIDARTIPTILGEPSFQAFLHPPGVGNCFVVDEEGASETDDIQWLTAKRNKALFLAQILQYFKDGVVHVGYSAPVFLPDWAGRVRHSGLFFLGEPRRDSYLGGNKPYYVAAAEKERLGTWWAAATTPKVIDALLNTRGMLRQAIYRAGDYYESSHRRLDPIERLIAIAVGFEALFSPSDQGELKFRISQLAAQFLGRDSSERQAIFKSIKGMYDRRSKIVHGSYDVEAYVNGRFVTADELDVWASYLRRALLGFLALYLCGAREAPRETILARIDEVNFDDSKRQKLQEDSDIEVVLSGCLQI